MYTLVKHALRVVRKNPLTTGIHIIGLALGLTASLLLIQYVYDERSYDQHLETINSLYRIRISHIDQKGVIHQDAGSYAGIGPAIKNDFPEIKAFTRITRKYLARGVFSYQEQAKPTPYLEENLFFASEAFFELFPTPFIQGQSELGKPNTMVISESMAQKYFSHENPIGKILNRNGTESYEITGVFQDIPRQTHLSFDMVLSFPTFVNIRPDVAAEHEWSWWDFYTYVTLEDGVSPEEVIRKFPGFNDKYIPKVSYERDELHLQPVQDIHLYSNHLGEVAANGNGRIITSLFIAAILILFLAWMNYWNLSIAQTLERFREAALKKVLGSGRQRLIWQVLWEAFFIHLLAGILAIILMALFASAFQDWLDIQIPLFEHAVFWKHFGIIFLLGCFLSGIYPAWMLSTCQPVLAVKGAGKISKSKINLRNGLVVFQYVLTFLTIGGSLVIYQQLVYMRNHDLNADIEHTLVAKVPSILDERFYRQLEAVKADLQLTSSISSVSITSAVPGIACWGAGGIGRIGDARENAVQMEGMDVDESYISTFNIPLLEGRFFQKSRPSDVETAVLNQSAIKVLGFPSEAESIGREIYMWGDTLEVIGVISDYYHLSLQNEQQPIVIRFTNEDRNYVAIKYAPQQLAETLDQLQENWAKHLPEIALDYFFLKEYFDQQYQSEEQFQKGMTFLSWVSLFIACLGLFGLSAFHMIQKRKEMGIRKVLGAAVNHLVILFAKPFLSNFGIALLIGIPLLIYLLQQWLNSFPYRIHFQLWVVLVPILLIGILSLLTMGYHINKRLWENPAESLKEI